MNQYEEALEDIKSIPIFQGTDEYQVRDFKKLSNIEVEKDINSLDELVKLTVPQEINMVMNGDGNRVPTCPSCQHKLAIDNINKCYFCGKSLLWKETIKEEKPTEIKPVDIFM